MIGAILRTAATAALLFGTAASVASAGDTSVYEATLAETNQKTAEVSTSEFRRILAAGSAVVVDSRPRVQFDADHIPGARSVEGSPTAQVAAVEHFVNGDKATPLVLYCNGPFCRASRRLADQLVAAGFTNVRRYQLGIPVWRALGGPTAIEIGGIARIYKADRTAVFLDGRSPHEFAKGTLATAHNLPADELSAGKLKKLPLPEDDFNRRVILFGRDGAQARRMAEALSKRPWHNVAYFPGRFEELAAALKGK